jgi:trimeric autotransporter adhesin
MLRRVVVARSRRLAGVQAAHRTRRSWLSLILVVVLGLLISMASTGSAGAVTTADDTSAPSISSDQADYTPGSQVVLTGEGWQPGEAVHLGVNDDLGRTWEYTADVTADDHGAITNTFTLPDWFVATYRVSATGAQSGTVTSTFTDGNIKVSAAIIGGGSATASMSGSTFNGNTTCSGTGTSVNKVDTISSGAGDSALVSTSATATAGGTTYDFDHWTYDGATDPAFNGDPLKTCATGFASGSKDLIALYRGRTTTTTLTGSAAPSVYGDALTLTATVTSTGGTPSGGTVSFKDGANSITGCGSVALSAAGTATCSFPALAAGTLSVGSHNLSATYSGSGSFPSSTANLTQVVNRRTLAGSFTASDKVYDGNTTAQISGRSLSGGIVGIDVVSLTGGTATFGNKSVGPSKTVTGSGFSLTGANAGSYQLASTTLTTTASIGTHALTLDFTASNKVYEGDTAAAITARTLTGVLAGDTVSVSGGTASFDTKNVGTGKAVSASGFTLGGADAANYVVTTIHTTTASITAKPITGSFTAQDKTYDGTRDAAIATRALDGVIGSDDASLSGGTAQFASKNAGTGIIVTGSGFSLTGTGASNYSLTSVADTTARINAKHVTGAFTASNKVYDGTRAATVATTSVPDKVSGDDVTLGGTAQFADAHAGVGKTVSFINGTLTGSDASNYALDGVSPTTADISAKSVTGSFTAADKQYDGTAAATITDRHLNDVVGMDDVSLTGGTATFANKNVGTGKTVTLTGASLSGTDAGNYRLDSVATTTADITRLAVVGHVTVRDKVYDGVTSASVLTRSVTGMVGGDDVTLTGGTATFDTKNVGTGKTVTLAGASLSGADADNYSLQSPEPSTQADITIKHITGSFKSDDKVYDGTTSASAHDRAVSGTVAGDDVALTGGTASFGNKNVGTGKTVTLTGATLGGTDAGNYELDSVDSTSADITARQVTVQFSAPGKVYDGTADATISGATLTGPVSGDNVGVDSAAATASFADKNVGVDKTVTAHGFTLTGADAGNYVIQTVAPTQADISVKHITGSFQSDDKVYDGNTSATAHDRALTGPVGGDDVSLTGGAATFGNKNVGTGKTVTLTGASLSGTDAGNYELDSVDTTTANITALSITGAFTADDKVYDGDTSASMLTRSVIGAVSGDAVSLTGGTAAFGNKNVGTGKTVTLTGAALSGGDAGNYTLTGVDTTTANITALSITGAFTADDKVYDGDTSASVLTRSVIGAVSGDAVSLTGGTATFANKNVGTGKTVTLTGASLSGGDAGNYTLDHVNTATADVTVKHISGSFKTDNKVYDGNTSATAHDRALTGTVTGNDVSLTGGTATFANKNVGTGKTVTLTGASLSGTDAGNYRLDSVATTTADITALSITGSITANDKVYDGMVTAVVATRNLSGVTSGDSVYLSGGTATFADKNVGNGKPVTLTGATLGGIDAGNYNLTSVATTTASITKATLTVTADNKAMVMGSALPTLTGQVVGNVAGDTLVATYSTTATSSSTGGFYPVTPSVSGTAAGVLGNYDVHLVNGTLNVTFVWNGFLQPVNDTAHQIGVTESKFKLGQVIPLKFDLATFAGANVQQTGNPVFSVGNYRASCDSDAVADTLPAVSADPSVVFVYTGGHYQYNWSTKSVTKPGEYRVFAALADGSKPWVDICLK